MIERTRNDWLDIEYATGLRTFIAYLWVRGPNVVQHGEQFARELLPVERTGDAGFKITKDDEAASRGPTFALDDAAVQSLMDQLWKLGVRPTDAGSADGELKATRESLARERILVDKILDVSLRRKA